MEQQTGFKEMFLRLVAIVGLIAVLILGAWGIILLAFNLVGLFTGSVDFSKLFSRTEQPATTTAPVVITQDGTGQTAPKPSSSVITPATPTYVYTQAPRASQLYGLADLAVTITSVTSLSSTQGRTVVQFTVSNIGTNVARSGWSFNALLPLSPAYTYQSQAQQALYPGDSIAYTLTYDDPSFRHQPCTLQYPNYNCNYNYDNTYYQNPYQYGYQNTGICYTYNGYVNVPGPCPTPANPNYNYFDQYNQNYNYYGQNYGHHPYGGVVTITIDPQNWVPEISEFNNTASKNVY
jgi:hypothetical protein